MTRDATQSLAMAPAPGYTPMVGALVAMLEYTRSTTLSGVATLGTAELDHQHDERANPIGAMLAHVAAVEWVHAVQTLGPPASAEEWAEWGPLIQLGPAAWTAARGRTLDAHVQRLRAVRERTSSITAGRFAGCAVGCRAHTITSHPGLPNEADRQRPIRHQGVGRAAVQRG